MTEAPKDRSTLIALLGIDGSGKTTQAARLVSWLRDRGEPAQYRKTRSGRTKLDKAARKGGFKDYAALMGPQAAAVGAASLGYTKLYEIREDFKQPGTWVVVDRYVQCHLVRAAELWPEGRQQIRTLFARYPEPDLMLYMTIDPVVAAQRTVVRGIGLANTADELANLDAMYRALPEAERYVEINADRDPDAVHQAVVAAVAARFDLN